MINKKYPLVVGLLVLCIIGLCTMVQPFMAMDTIANQDALFATVGSDINHYSETDGLIKIGNDTDPTVGVVIYPKKDTDIRSYAHLGFTMGNYGLTTYINQYLFEKPRLGINWSETIFNDGLNHYILVITPDGLTMALDDLIQYEDKIDGIVLVNTTMNMDAISFDGWIIEVSDSTNSCHGFATSCLTMDFGLETDLAMVKTSDDSVVMAQNKVVAAILDRLHISNHLNQATGLTNVIIELTTYPNDKINTYLDDPNYAVSLVTDPSGKNRLKRIERKLQLGGEIIVIDAGVNDIEAIEALCNEYGADLIML